MAYTATTTLYNQVYIDNYDYLVDWAYNDSDRTHDCYLKVLNKATGFTATTLTAIQNKLLIYLKTAIYNQRMTEKRLQKNNVQLEDNGYETEAKLRLEDNYNDDNETEIQQLEYYTKKLFEYIKPRYTEQENYVFRCYYLYDEHKRLTYKELSKVTGYSISKCCNIIQKMRTDIRDNLNTYING